ncbi:unnamed protein product, partial [Tetraodon nigroviridis]
SPGNRLQSKPLPNLHLEDPPSQPGSSQSQTPSACLLAILMHQAA